MRMCSLFLWLLVCLGHLSFAGDPQFFIESAGVNRKIEGFDEQTKVEDTTEETDGFYFSLKGQTHRYDVGDIKFDGKAISFGRAQAEIGFTSIDIDFKKRIVVEVPGINKKIVRVVRTDIATIQKPTLIVRARKAISLRLPEKIQATFQRESLTENVLKFKDVASARNSLKSQIREILKPDNFERNFEYKLVNVNPLQRTAILEYLRAKQEDVSGKLEKSLSRVVDGRLYEQIGENFCKQVPLDVLEEGQKLPLMAFVIENRWYLGVGSEFGRLPSWREGLTTRFVSNRSGLEFLLRGSILIENRKKKLGVGVSLEENYLVYTPSTQAETRSLERFFKLYFDESDLPESIAMGVVLRGTKSPKFDYRAFGEQGVVLDLTLQVVMLDRDKKEDSSQSLPVKIRFFHRPGEGLRLTGITGWGNKKADSLELFSVRARELLIVSLLQKQLGSPNKDLKKVGFRILEVGDQDYLEVSR